MKKLFYLLSAAALLAGLNACSKEENAPETTQEDNLVTYTFTASAENDEEVRSTLSNAGAFAWAEGDKIAIYNSATSSYVEFTVDSVDGSGNATIMGAAAAGAVWTNAIYPAARAAGSGNAVDYTVTSVAGPILVSKVVGQDLSFRYLGAVMNIQVTDVPGSPVSLTVTANANVFGNRSFDWSGESPVLGGSGTQATVTVPFNTSGITSVPVPQASYAGFSITVDTAAGRHLYKKSTANTFNLSEKKLLPMPTLAYSEPGYYVKTTSSTNYWDTASARMIQTGANTYVLSENCDGNSTYYIFDEYNIDQPTTGYLATGLAKSTFSTGDSSWGLVGTGFEGSTWDQTSPVEMQFEGDWQYVKNIKFTQEWPQIKFVTGGSWDSAIGATITHSDSEVNNNVYVAEYGEIASQGSSTGNIYVGGVTANSTYDIFLNPGTREVRVFLSSAAHDPNEASGIWTISYNSSSGVATHTWKSAVKDDPFGDAGFPTTGYGFKSDFDGWSSVHNSSTTYANCSWTIAGITIASADTKAFGLCNGASDFWTDLSTDSTFDTVNPGTNLYGTLTYWRDGSHANPTVTLEAGSYVIYANVNPDVDGGINLMFVKQ